MGDVEDENGTPTPKKGRRGRKRKMQSRKDDDDDDTGAFEHASAGPARNRGGVGFSEGNPGTSGCFHPSVIFDVKLRINERLK